MNKNRAIILILILIIIVSLVGIFFVFHKDSKKNNSEKNRNSVEIQKPAISNAPTTVQTGEPLLASNDIIFFDAHNKLLNSNPSIFFKNKFVNAIILQAGWSEIEPKRGSYDFSVLDNLIDARYNSGQKVALRIISYGQTDGNAVTPAWVYETVPKIEFSSKKDKRGDVVIPKVWDQSFLLVYNEFVSEVAKHYDSDKRVDYIEMGVGHIGYTTATPSPEGSAAFLNAGWAPTLWEDYVKSVLDIYASNFKNKKLILAMTPIFLPQKYLLNQHMDVGKNIAKRAAEKGCDILFKGVDEDPIKFDETGFPELIKYLTTLNLNNFKIGFGDDWPMYGQTGSKVRTVEDFKAILANIENLWNTIGEKYPIFIVMLEPELSAVETGNKMFNQEVYNSLSELVDGIN